MTSEKLDALIFIDTNILLDFYRIRRSNVSMQYLEKIVSHKDLIISTSQIEMEFKTNRQSAILESIGEINKLSIQTNFPAIISNAEATKKMATLKKDVEQQKNKIKQRIERILKKPSENDPVYKALQNLWKNQSDYNLNRENKKRFAIRKLAGKRFIMGYPPRKEKDTSIGDAINWEWIIKCAEISGKSIIIVSRDQDYGIYYRDESFLDDWLLNEFKERISQQRKIVFTDRLSQAFKKVEIPVTIEMEEEENKIIDLSKFNSQMKALSKLFKGQDFRFEDMRNAVAHFRDPIIDL